MSNEENSPETSNEERGLLVARVFDAPRELLWKAWTEPECFKRWWGPRHYTAPVIRIDFRVGGKYHYCMRSPDGKDFWSTGVYREIVPLERFVAVDSFADADGNVVPATYYGMDPDIRLERQVVVTFADLYGKTLMAVRQAGMPAGRGSEFAVAGWGEAFDKLAASLADPHPDVGSGR